MYLQNLRLINFKNITEKQFFFSKKINCFVGNNGMGKTNILDSIHYLSLTKSYLNHSDVQNINFGQAFFIVEGIFIDEEQNIENQEEQENLEKENLVKLIVHSEQKKKLTINSKIYNKLSDHIGKFPCVMISPYDHNLITEGSDFRRKFLDGMISQINIEYLHYLIRYHKALNQRNALLKIFALNNTFDPISLEIYDEELISNGKKIFEMRETFVNEYIHKVIDYYSLLSSEKEIVGIVYKSDLRQRDLKEILSNSVEKDRKATHTTCGIHKDDLEFTLLDRPIKKYGSQGQQKSFLISLKLAQMSVIKSHRKIKPLLLLDDIFDKLDENRVIQLVKLVHEQEFGQLFITDTHKERTIKLVEQISDEYKIFSL